jgi:hypothetical protein
MQRSARSRDIGHKASSSTSLFQQLQRDTCCTQLWLPLQKSELAPSPGQKHVDLVLLKSGAQTHFAWIKSFSRFAKQPSDHHKNAKHYCHDCLHGFPTADKLEASALDGLRFLDTFRDWWGTPNVKTFNGWKNDTREFLGFLLRKGLKGRCAVKDKWRTLNR